ncbi:MAG TPA: imelysin family protein [Pseudomonadales bacterium]|nr:imelysin family protein [Pseudomonadales bacterium]
MRSSLLARFSWTALCAALTACAPPTPEQNAITAIYKTMTPHYAQWREASAAFSVTSNNFCHDKNTLAEARNSWQQAMLAWTGVQAFPAGPINDKNYATQVTYWPDPKNLVAFQIEARLKNDTPIALAESSVALRGLTAAEYILFDQSHDLTQTATRQRYCPLLLAIGIYQTNFSSSTEKEWLEFSKKIAKFPNDRFANAQEVVTEFLRVQVTMLDGLGKHLQEPLKSGHAQIYQLEYWRSGQTQAGLHAAIKMDEALWHNGWRALAAAKDEDLVTSIDQTYTALLGNIAPVSLQPLSVSITTTEGLAWIRNRQSELHMLDTLYGRALAKTLGVQIGFNANDGD